MKLKENSRQALRIAKMELNTMFYSPVAWLILVVFAFHTGLIYADLLNDFVHQQAMEKKLSGLTALVFGKSDFFGLMSDKTFFLAVTKYLYLYIPLITMGVLSKEYSSGSIRLLFSSPISNKSIVVGKYMAVMTFGLILWGIVFLYVLYSGIVIGQFDWGHAWVGLLGVFLLIGVYSAIGLFMSSITVYPVVAALGTLALLAVLNYIGNIGQGIDFFRDITYWLALNRKMKDFAIGLIPSESVIYFLALILFFLYMTLLRLTNMRTRCSRSLMAVRYAVVTLLLVAVSLVSSRPSCKFYSDCTAIQRNTLSSESLQILDKVDGPLKITTYVNILSVYWWQYLLPAHINEDKKRFEYYTRFKPEIEFEYVYYWDKAENESLDKTYPDLSDEERAKLLCYINHLDFEMLLTPEQVRRRFDTRPYDNQIVRVFERGNGMKDVLPLYGGHNPYAGERGITSVLKHLAGERFWVTYVEKHSHRSILPGGSDWWTGANFFYEGSLWGMGFNSTTVDLLQEEIPAETKLLVLPPLDVPLSAEEQKKIDAYLAAGGNLLVMSAAGTQENEKSVLGPLGVSLTSELAVGHSANPTTLLARVNKDACDLIPGLSRLVNDQAVVIQKDVAAIDYRQVKDYRVTPVVTAPAKGVWLEKEDLVIGEEAVTLNADAGEREDAYPFVIAMEKPFGERMQRIIVSTDEAWFGSDYYRLVKGPDYINFRLFSLMLNWLSEGAFPILAEKEQPKDNHIILKNRDRKYNTLVMEFLFPGLLLGIGLGLIRRRKKY